MWNKIRRLWWVVPGLGLMVALSLPTILAMPLPLTNRAVSATAVPLYDAPSPDSVRRLAQTGGDNASGAYMLKDINPALNTASASPQLLTNVSGTLFWLSGSLRGYPHIWGYNRRKNVEIVACQIIWVSNHET